jgi:hypothetical protein
MGQKSTPRIDDKEWERYKPVLKELYCEQKLTVSQVQKEMEVKYEFVAR